MVEVRLTMEEYEALLRAADDPRMESGMRKFLKREMKPKIVKKRSGKKDPKMARALRKANSMGRKKSGGFKKGWSQGKIMKKAHQLRRRM